MTTGDPLDVALRVVEALDACGLRYTIGGSLASSLSGEPRSTLDIDMVVALGEADVPCLLRALGTEFYADDAGIRRAVRQRASTNLIHQPTGIKIDLFVAGGSPIDEQQLERRQRVQVKADPSRSLYFHTPEDILLQKLRWFRLGGEVSDRQWRDILGVLLVQQERLDFHYLRHQADLLSVADLLAKATDESASR